MSEEVNHLKLATRGGRVWISNGRAPYAELTEADLAAFAERIREDCASMADQWSKPSVVKLAAGEMTAAELRTAQAVARGLAAAIRKG